MTLSRRTFVAGLGVGLSVLAQPQIFLAATRDPQRSRRGESRAIKARRMVRISLLGGPSQLDLFDYKAKDASAAIIPSAFRFAQHGQSGTWVSELLPHHARMADDLCLIRSMTTDAADHLSASRLLHTGTAKPGGASLGSVISSVTPAGTADVPAFVALHAESSAPGWARHAMPPDICGAGSLGSGHSAVGFAADLANESPATVERYGPDAAIPGTFAHAALSARRLIEQGVGLVQIFHRGWDLHANLARDLPRQCRDIDQACLGLVQDLKDRGLLQDTLVFCTGEFGRAAWEVGTPNSEPSHGRDHHADGFSCWLAGAGVKAGHVHGETDERGRVAGDPVHVSDLRATLLHLAGIEPQPFVGPNARVTRGILA